MEPLKINLDFPLVLLKDREREFQGTLKQIDTALEAIESNLLLIEAGVYQTRVDISLLRSSINNG